MELGVIINDFFVHYKYVNITYVTFIIVASSFASKHSQSSNTFLNPLQ